MSSGQAIWHTGVVRLVQSRALRAAHRAVKLPLLDCCVLPATSGALSTCLCVFAAPQLCWRWHFAALCSSLSYCAQLCSLQLCTWSRSVAVLDTSPGHALGAAVSAFLCSTSPLSNVHLYTGRLQHKPGHDADRGRQ